jgi:peptide/nickel transport system permease protein
VSRKDYPVAQGCFLVMAALIVVMNLLADVLYGYLDPRITFDGSAHGAPV